MSKYETGYKSDVLRYAIKCAINERLSYLEGLKEGIRYVEGIADDEDNKEWMQIMIAETKAEIRDFQKLYRSFY